VDRPTPRRKSLYPPLKETGKPWRPSYSAPPTSRQNAPAAWPPVASRSGPPRRTPPPWVAPRGPRDPPTPPHPPAPFRTWIPSLGIGGRLPPGLKAPPSVLRRPRPSHLPAPPGAPPPKVPSTGLCASIPKKIPPPRAASRGPTPPPLRIPRVVHDLVRVPLPWLVPHAPPLHRRVAAAPPQILAGKPRAVQARLAFFHQG